MSTKTTAVPPAITADDRDSNLQRILAPKPSFALIRPADTQRAAAEAFVAEKFWTAWQARLTSFLPYLVGMTCLGSCTAVAGLRPAAGRTLFLEQYLDTPIESALSRSVQKDIPRNEIVEIGNLVAKQRGASHLLFLVFTVALHRAGYRWITFTATRGLRNNLQKLGFPLLTLASASPDRLEPGEREEWGSYYESEPLVMAGNLDDAMSLITTRPLLRRVMRIYRTTIGDLAAGLQEAP